MIGYLPAPRRPDVALHWSGGALIASRNGMFFGRAVPNGDGTWTIRLAGLEEETFTGSETEAKEHLRKALT